MKLPEVKIFIDEESTNEDNHEKYIDEEQVSAEETSLKKIFY